ncbi:MAG: class I SAM-dependent DNA methyltransferase [Planctomycetaceae bacterium]|nr:class I SAM-dependent DNA methyltransferase [Planctomycetaceae bacterium]
MTPQEFVAKWQRANLSERAACQEHFIDLCALVGHPTPAAADPEGEWYAFERGVTKTEGSHGWADVWKKDFFGWEYKRKHRDLVEAYRQLQLYREDLGNPPLLVVCDLNRFEIHTNFTGTAKKVYAFALDELAEPANLDVLRKLFHRPEELKPRQTTEEITVDAAGRFGLITDGLRQRGVEAHAAAHFVMKLMFCMFAEDIGLLPDKIFKTTLDGAKQDPRRLAERLRSLFRAMAKGGDFGPVEIPFFNGGLFDGVDDVVELTPDEILQLIAVNAYDWASVEPSIFGTLFERSLDPAKRSQIGAHYTSRDDILTLLEPVVMTPLRREWHDVRGKADALWEKVLAEAKANKGKKSTAAVRKAAKDSPRAKHDRLLRDFVERLAEVTVLDPACGSGNFLYVAINLLLDLEKEVIAYAATHGASLLPQVRPTQLAGLEINPYAQQLAQVVIWIGYLQWKYDNQFPMRRDPILEPIETIRQMDAILDLSDPENPKEPEWPKADFIVGNPPFLGGKRMLAELGEEYVEALRKLWEARLPRFSDLCCYWFEKARDQISKRATRRAGLLATQGIRGGANRTALDRIKKSGDIFFAISDRDWVLDGATVHVSIVGFDNGDELERLLDGASVTSINADLTFGANTTTAVSLKENLDRAFVGVQKSGGFDVQEANAIGALQLTSVAGRPMSDVIRPYYTAIDVVRRPTSTWIYDFTGKDEQVSSLYQQPFESLRAQMLEDRSAAHFGGYPFWLYWRPRPEMYRALKKSARYLVTPHVSKHRIFAWVSPAVVCSNLLIVVASDDDYDFGVLQSKAHENWARMRGTQLREEESGCRYTATTCFETFPFPTPTDAQREAIAAAAKELDTLRNNWLNPPEWTREEVLEFPGSVDGPWARYVVAPNERGIGTVRYPRVVPKDADCAKRLAKRTLTNLYNERPTWLDLAHKRLDAAVFAAYGWPADISDDDLLARLLALNLQRAAAQGDVGAAAEAEGDDDDDDDAEAESPRRKSTAGKKSAAPKKKPAAKKKSGR